MPAATDTCGSGGDICVPLPTDCVFIPVGVVAGYLSPHEAILDDFMNAPALFQSDEVLEVQAQSPIYPGIFHVRDIKEPTNPSPYYWIYAGDGRVTPEVGANCDDVPIDSDPAATYAIRITSDNNSSRIWSEFERKEIIASVKEIGDAFALISTIQPSTSVEAFNRVFTSVPETYPPFVLVVRAQSSSDSPWRSPNTGDDANNPAIPDVTVTFEYEGGLVTGYYPDIANVNCKAFEARQFLVSDPNLEPKVDTSVFLPGAIICNGNLQNQTPNLTEPVSPVPNEASQHTIVHELGHVFDYLTDFTITNVLGDNFVLGACASTTTQNLPSTVMGMFRGQWLRGSRGWGSAPPFSKFIQSPDDGSWSEATADMFLNWVYRTNGGGTTPIVGYSIREESPPEQGCIPLANQVGSGVIEIWSGGFYNRFPDPNQSIKAALFDWSLSGDIRHSLMNDLMKMHVFATHEW